MFLQSLQQAINDQLNLIEATRPHCRVALVTFNDVVSWFNSSCFLWPIYNSSNELLLYSAISNFDFWIFGDLMNLFFLLYCHKLNDCCIFCFFFALFLTMRTFYCLGDVAWRWFSRAGLDFKWISIIWLWLFVTRRLRCSNAQ